MGRFFFDLQGRHNASDPTGLVFETELGAFRAAQRLAAELSSARPNLRGSTCVVGHLSWRRPRKLFCGYVGH